MSKRPHLYGNLKCPRCGEWYEPDEVDDEQLFFRRGCGAALGTVCDGGTDALVAQLERMFA